MLKDSYIRLLETQDVQKLEQYLSPHKAECMFICSNLKAAGIEYQDTEFSGEYWGCFSNSDDLQGVIAHYWSGNVMMWAPEKYILEALVVHFSNNSTRGIAGILGPNIQAEFVINKLGLSNASYKINRNEELYEIDLDDLKEPTLLDNLRVVEAKEIARDLFIRWVQEYAIEALGESSSPEHKKNEEDDVGKSLKDRWVLIDNGVPVSLSGFNARLEDIVQVGPVWTPPKHRNKGYARLVVAFTLAKERRKGAKKAILFTDNPPAIKAYKAIGFKNIGNYRLAILKNPIHLSLAKD